MSVSSPTKALAEVCEIKPPKSEAKRKLNDADPVSFVPMEDLGIDQKYLAPNSERKLGQVAGSYTYFAEGDVLLAKITPCFENGKLGIAKGLTNGVGFGSSEYIVFRPSRELSNEYLYYFLAQDSFRTDGIRTMSGAVGHKRVSKEFVERYQIPVPPIAEQQRIVAILAGAFAGLATATANAEKNLKNARELFESYVRSVFVKREGEWIQDTLGNTCDMYQPKTISARELVETGRYPVYGANGEIGRYDKFNHEEAQLLVTCRGATCGAINVSQPKSWITGNAMVVRPKTDEIDLGFLEFAFRGGIDLSRAITGAAQPQITRTSLVPISISYPKSVDEQRRLSSIFEQLRDESIGLRKLYSNKLKSLIVLKQSILQKAFSGDLTSSPAQAVNEAAE